MPWKSAPAEARTGIGSGIAQGCKRGCVGSPAVFHQFDPVGICGGLGDRRVAARGKPQIPVNHLGLYRLLVPDIRLRLVDTAACLEAEHTSKTKNGAWSGLSAAVIAQHIGVHLAVFDFSLGSVPGTQQRILVVSDPETSQ